MQRLCKNIEQRTKLLERIHNAGKKEDDKASKLLSGAFGLARKAKEEVQGLAGEKRDPQREMLEKILSFYRDTPMLLTDETSIPTSEAMIKDLLKLRRLEMARAWRMKAAEVLTQERNSLTNHENNSVPVNEKQEPDTDPSIPVVENTGSDTTNTQDSTEEPTSQGHTSDSGMQDTENIIGVDFTRSSAQHSDKNSTIPGSSEGHSFAQTSDKDQTQERYSSALTALDTIRSKGRRKMDIAEASQVTGYDVSYLKKLVSSDKVSSYGTDNNTLLLSSLCDYIRRQLSDKTQTARAR